MNLQIGILACDHVDKTLLEAHGDYHDMFFDLVQKQDSTVKFKVFDVIAQKFPVHLSDCDAYIITGSKFGAYEDLPWIHKAKSFIKRIYDAKIPTIGICFGHQLIAEALGGKVVKAEDKGRGLGVQTWDITSKKSWMETSPDLFSLNACHQDQVIEMPEKSELFASSEFCPIAGFQTGTMLAFQGHPEFDYDYTKYLFDKYYETLDKESLRITEETFKEKPDSDLIGAWMVSFIKNQLETAKNDV